ncbi:O-antigen ligase family protein [Enterococcus faecalis]|uniref:O-antigen ligase family protein n=1 Tax=Enterococcus faecalis TaxID=1351 RepID=UPI0025B092BD|nr:O-antigen ligase family protein [Enterococcus faecalis]MDN3185227.1 O-antigen ligase family protein [Enterococcus faecalis]
MKKKTTIRRDTRIGINFLLVCFIFFPMVDTLTGLFRSMQINFPIGIMYRMLLILAMVVINLLNGIKLNKLFFNSCITFLILLVIILCQTLYFQRDFGLTFQEFTSLLKFYLWIIILNFVVQMSHKITRKDIENIFIYSNLIFTVCYILPKILGLGETSYEDSSAGYKAFFIGINDATYVLIILASFLVVYILCNNELSNIHRIFLIILFFIDIFIFIIMGTKTALLSGVLLFIFFTIQFFYNRSTINIYMKLIYFICLLISFVFILFFGKDMLGMAWAGSFNRLKYFYELYTGNILRFITSSRSTYLGLAFKQLFTFKVIGLFLGVIGFGYDYRWVLFNRRGGLIEMDFFDIYFSYGLIGFLLWTIFIVYLMCILCKQKKMDIYAWLFLISLFYSFFAGHVFFSALSTSVFGFICSAIVLSTEKGKGK